MCSRPKNVIIPPHPTQPDHWPRSCVAAVFGRGGDSTERSFWIRRKKFLNRTKINSFWIRRKKFLNPTKKVSESNEKVSESNEKSFWIQRKSFWIQRKKFLNPTKKVSESNEESFWIRPKSFWRQSFWIQRKSFWIQRKSFWIQRKSFWIQVSESRKVSESDFVHQEHVRKKQSLINGGVQELLSTRVGTIGCYLKMDCFFYRYPFIPPFNIGLAAQENTGHSKKLMKPCAETSWDLAREVGHNWFQPNVVSSYFLPGWKIKNRKWVSSTCPRTGTHNH